MQLNIKPSQYKIYENGIFQLKGVHFRTGSGMVENTGIKDGKNPVMVEAEMAVGFWLPERHEVQRSVSTEISRDV